MEESPITTVIGKTHIVRLNAKGGVFHICKGKFNVTVDGQDVLVNYRIANCGDYVSILNTTSERVYLVFDKSPDGKGILGYLVIHGKSDYYVLDLYARSYTAITGVSNPKETLVTLNDTMIVYPAPYAYNASNNGRLRVSGSTVYHVSWVDGIIITTGVVPLFYSTAKRDAYSASIIINMSIIGRFNATDIAGILATVPLGEVEAGTPVNITLYPPLQCGNQNVSILLDTVKGLWKLPSLRVTVQGHAQSEEYSLVLGENIIVPRVSGNLSLIVYDIPLEIPNPWIYKQLTKAPLDRKIRGTPIYAGGMIGCAVTPLIAEVQKGNETLHLLLWPRPESLAPLLEQLAVENAIARVPVGPDSLDGYGYIVYLISGGRPRLLATTSSWSPSVPSGPLLWVGVWSPTDALQVNLVNQTGVQWTVEVPLYTSFYARAGGW